MQYHLIKIFLLVISICSLSNHLHCQELEGIKGKVVDINNKPLPYATIRLKNISMGVVSNQNGDFRLPFKQHIFQDTLIVSYIGYATLKLSMATLKAERNNIIVLKESPTHMSEVEIYAKRKGRLNAKKIAAAAINSIEINYPMHLF